MTILLLGTNITTGGAQRVLLDLAQAFHSKNLSVVAAFFYDKDNLLQSWQNQFQFPIICFNAWNNQDSTIKRITRLINAYFRMINWMKKKQFSSILTLTHDSNILGLPAAWLSGIPRRFGSHHVRYPSLSKFKIKIHNLVINSKISTGLVAVSSFTKQQAIEEGVNPGKIKVIFNGIDPKIENKIKHNLAQWKLDEFGPMQIILNVGRLVPQKGQDLFINVAAKVLKQRSDVLFLIAGEGEFHQVLQAQIQQLGLAEHVKLLGNRKDIPDLLAVADVFVSSSRFEGLPMSLLEAMAAGIAVVSTDIPGVRDIISHRETGLLCQPEDEDALAQSILTLLSNEDLRKTLALQGKRLVNLRFTLDGMALQYLNLLEGEHVENK